MCSCFMIKMNSPSPVIVQLRCRSTERNLGDVDDVRFTSHADALRVFA